MISGNLGSCEVIGLVRRDLGVYVRGVLFVIVITLYRVIHKKRPKSREQIGQDRFIIRTSNFT